jgi:hypothetical protein
MKPISHAWVAVNSVPQGNQKLLILGSILPEIMFYTENHPFVKEEIHEGGEKVYQYLKMSNPQWADLGLGMITHSFHKGADQFNLDEKLAILGYEGEMAEDLRKKLMSALNVTYERAKGNAHNILELAVELGIIRDHPEFIDEVQQAIADKQTKEEIKNILADCFNKPKDKVSRAIDQLFEKIKPQYLRSAEGLAQLWQEFILALSDPEPDVKRLAEVLKELSAGFNGRDKEFLEQAISWTRSNIEAISPHPERKTR